MTPSALQERILETVRASNENLIIQAAAGSGKTSTLKLIAEQLKPSALRTSSVIALCFNRSIADEFGRKLPSYVVSSTMHSCGMKTIQSAFRKVKVEPKKKFYLACDWLADGNFRHKQDERNKFKIAGALSKAASTVLAVSANPEDLDQLDTLCTVYSIDLDPRYYDAVALLVKSGRDKTWRIDFDDMIDLPVYYGMKFQRYDYVLVDEAQDLNKQQLLFLEALANGSSRIIAVGDKNQAIYGFRGAMSNSMEEVKQHFNCTQLPLSVCYRCDSKIVDLARNIVGDDIEAAPGAHEGEVTHRESVEWVESIPTLQDGDMVICRNNAPLAQPVMELITMGRKAVIRGRDIGEGLISLLRKKDDNDKISSTLDAVSDFVHEKAAKLAKRGEDGAASLLFDQLECIDTLGIGCHSTSELIAKIGSIFSDDREGVVFSSIHRAKGLEAERVVFLGPELIPSKYATSEEQLQQEQNLKYVAVTRAMNNLVLQHIDRDIAVSEEVE